MKHGNFPALSRLLHVSMVLLGVTMSGEKLATLVVFKGVPDARIQREFNNQQFTYPPQMVYCCQAKAWVDELVFAL